MKKCTKHRLSTLLFYSFSFFASGSHAQSLTADAGINQSVCRSGDTVVLGGFPTALGGTRPYTYSWSPASGMNNPAEANPHVKIASSLTNFMVVVTDAAGNKANDTTTITLDSVNYASAGSSRSFCGGTPVVLGSSANAKTLHYSWSPTIALSCSTCPQPTATPTAATTYTLVATDPSNSCSDTTTVTISPDGAKITTVSPVTLDRGHSIFLQASGGVKYNWFPQKDMFNPTSSTPEVEPEVTFTYYVSGTDGNGCNGYDSVVVMVNDDSALTFYNTFTPNGDGINDTWFIGNISLYPNNDLYVYNRYGKVVYYTHGYYNQWDGNTDDKELPAATYYYVLLTGTGKTYKGSVTIIRVK